MDAKDIIKNIDDYKFEIELLLVTVSQTLVSSLDRNQPAAFIKMWQEEQHHMLRDLIMLERRRKKISQAISNKI